MAGALFAGRLKEIELSKRPFIDCKDGTTIVLMRLDTIGLFHSTEKRWYIVRAANGEANGKARKTDEQEIVSFFQKT